jgi:hypothetical protein
LGKASFKLFTFKVNNNIALGACGGMGKAEIINFDDISDSIELRHFQSRAVVIHLIINIFFPKKGHEKLLNHKFFPNIGQRTTKSCCSKTRKFFTSHLNLSCRMESFLSWKIFMNTLKFASLEGKVFTTQNTWKYGKISLRRKSRQQQESKTTYDKNFE